MDSLDIRGYVPIFWYLESMTSSLASGGFSDYLSSSWPSVRESRISPKGPCPCFLWQGDLYPGLVCLLNVLPAPVLCLRRIIGKRKEFGLKWGFVLISLVYLRPWGTRYTSDFPQLRTYREYQLIKREGLLWLIILEVPSHDQLGFIALGLGWDCISWHKHMAEWVNLLFDESGSDEKERGKWPGSPNPS